MAIDRSRPDPAKLLGIWTQFEKGESMPGRLVADLKIAGMKELLEGLVATELEAAGHDR